MIMSYGALLVFTDVSGIDTDEVRDWYHNHVAASEKLPGVLRTTVWVDADNPSLFVAFYDVDEEDVLGSAAFEAITASRSGDDVPQALRDPVRQTLRAAAQRDPGEDVSPVDSAALYIPSLEMAEEALDEYADWYRTEHRPSLLAVEGVLMGRRFEIAQERNKFMAVYHVSDPALPGSPPWKAATETPWTLKMRKHMSNLQRQLFLPAL